MFIKEIACHEDTVLSLWGSTKCGVVNVSYARSNSLDRTRASCFATISSENGLLATFGRLVIVSYSSS